ncbi:hypothetical protein GCM10009119_31440 [Algoriphagus jejuensis]|uniref:Guanylate cyclase domain-containing protein n=2 Tax=Algoriphagus jejuensis TaxID=419934 RepID=A0ABN1N3J6_9BACT
MQAELKRKPSTVYFSDIVGYTRLMGKDENAAFELMRENLRIHQEVLANFRGKLIKELGDGILAVFDSAIDALHASLEVQKRCIAHGQYQLRIGLQSGEVIFDHGDIFGDAVNVASRIQSVGIPSSIVFSEKVCKETYQYQAFQTVKLGGFELKNVDHTLELYALTNPPLAIPKRSEVLGNIKYQEGSPWKYRSGIAAIIVLFGALIYSIYWGDTTWKKEKSVAVFPFELLDENAELDYFTEGLTENLIGQISKINSIKTISYGTMSGFKNLNSPLDSIAEVLGVNTILKGIVQQLNQGYRFKLQLIDVKENKNIWTDEYTREGTDLTLLQNEIAREIARILDARLTAEEAVQIGKGETTNAEAYDLLFKAKRLYNEAFEDPTLFSEAEVLLKSAINLDPNYALAYTLLAKVYFQIAFDDPNGPWYDLSLKMSQKALQLEPKLAEAFGARGMVYYDLGQYINAKNSFETALSFYPNLSDAIGNLASVEFAQGNLVKAIDLQTKSLNLGPNSYTPYQNLGWIYKILGNYQEAHLWFDRSLDRNEVPATHELKAFTYIQEGKADSALFLAERIKKMDYVGYKELGFIYFYSHEMDSAFQSFEQVMQGFEGGAYPRYSSVPIAYSYLLKLKGKSLQADSILNESILVKKNAIDQGYEDYYLPLELANAYAIKDQFEESLKYLQMAYERGWRDYFFTEFNPIFSDFKKDPKYAKILYQLQKDIREINEGFIGNSLERSQ